MTNEQQDAVNYSQALGKAWHEFVDKQGFYLAEFPSVQGDLIGKAFTAGWITGLGSIYDDSTE